MHTRRTAMTAMALGVCAPAALAPAAIATTDAESDTARLVPDMAKTILSRATLDSWEVLAMVAAIEIDDLNIIRADVEQRARTARSTERNLSEIYRFLNADDFRAGRYETLGGRAFSFTDLALLSTAL